MKKMVFLLFCALCIAGVSRAAVRRLSSQAQEIVQEELAALGINTNLEVLPNSEENQAMPLIWLSDEQYTACQSPRNQFFRRAKNISCQTVKSAIFWGSLIALCKSFSTGKSLLYEYIEFKPGKGIISAWRDGAFALGALIGFLKSTYDICSKHYEILAAPCPQEWNNKVGHVVQLSQINKRLRSLKPIWV